MDGVIILPDLIKTSMISIGLPGNEMFEYETPCIWNDQGGKIQFNGIYGTNAGLSLTIREGATITFGNGVSMGYNCRILCQNSIFVDEQALLSWDITIMDTDSHRFYDITNDLIPSNNKPIVIHKHCFVGFGCVLLKGANLPAYSSLSAKSVLVKSYSKSHSLYGGVPATLLKDDVCYMRDSAKVEIEKALIRNERNRTSK